ncbi:hypothetical protein MVEN_01727300 [Mycena venus]|uniref:DUF6534 domain-containing protein n=1 Tax=Mycena venus TaxID=2733690 RepID=A0A8H7CP10_9AGAR|nr:hypothetical protein MVEN_01727300 [Mycena venus]
MASELFLKDLTKFILGGWDLGIYGDLMLQGALFAQFAHFASLYHRDIASIRTFVWLLFAMTTLKTVQCLVILWIQNVKHFGDILSAGNMFNTEWTEQFNVGLSAIIAFYVQLFFCQRLWALSRNKYIIAVILGIFVFALIAGFVAGAFTLVLDTRRSQWTSIHLGVTVTGDILLTGSTAFFLLRHSKEVLPETAGMLRAILRLTLQSAAPAAICALVNLITNQVGSATDGANAWTMLGIISSVILPKLYAVSAMWTLNSRKDIRLARSNGQNTSSTEGRSGGLSGGRRPTHNLELGAISGIRTMPIQVRAQVQTVQHTDPEDMYSPKAGLDDLSDHIRSKN